jgi:hypothetical protein
METIIAAVVTAIASIIKSILEYIGLRNKQLAARPIDPVPPSISVTSSQEPMLSEAAIKKGLDFWDGLSDSILIVFGAKYKENEKEGHVTLSLRDLSAAQEIFNFLKLKYSTTKSIESIPAISKIPGTTFDWYTYLKPTTDLIVIGGFVANSEFNTHRELYQRHFRLKMGRICQKEEHRVFHIETNKGKYFSRNNPSEIEDLPSSSIKTDFAFVSNSKVTISESTRRVITIAGIKGNGTLGAAKYLTNKEIPELAQRKIAGDSRLELVIKTDIANNDVIDNKELVAAVWGEEPVYERKPRYWEPCETPHINCEQCLFGESYHPKED